MSNQGEMVVDTRPRKRLSGYQAQPLESLDLAARILRRLLP